MLIMMCPIAEMLKLSATAGSRPEQAGSSKIISRWIGAVGHGHDRGVRVWRKERKR